MVKFGDESQVSICGQALDAVVQDKKKVVGSDRLKSGEAKIETRSTLVWADNLSAR
jgi:hypothetical protein